MGFGKWVLGGVCAVGAVVAAPVALPAMGAAILTSSTVGATTAGISAGLAMLGASSGTVATVAGAAGFAAGAAQEKKREEAYDKGRRDGNVSASKVFEEKMRDQEQFFNAKTKECVSKINELEKKLTEYKDKEELTQEEIRERDQIIDEMLECIKELEKEHSGEERRGLF